MRTLTGWPWRKIGFLLLALILLFPYPTLLCPAWKIRVMDAAGQPVQQALVIQDWWYFSNNESEVMSDEQGYASFPERYAWASLLRRGMNSVWRVISLHGGGLPLVSIRAYGHDKDENRLEGYVPLNRQEPPPAVITLRPMWHP